MIYQKKYFIRKDNLNNINVFEKRKSKLIEENYFVIDSNNLEHTKSHMYGFCVSKIGILTDNYYKKIGYYEIPEPQGVFVMIQKKRNEIRLYQDFHGSFGIYIYENKNKNYFALSNSFVLLAEYLIGKEKISFNKNYADNLIISSLYTYSLNETLIKEIMQVPSNAFIAIDISTKTFNINYIDYNENTIPLESEEGYKIIDKWVDKWGYIIRSLKKQTDNLSCDLSGGLDTRTLISIILNSGININDILIRSANDKKHVHEEDFKIASNISSNYGFKLNNFTLDNKGMKLHSKESLLCTIYAKLGFHKEFYLKNKFFIKPKFSFSGSGGEDLRGSPGQTIKDYIENVSSKTKIANHEEEFYNSSKRLMERSVAFLKKFKSYNNEYEISYDLYSRIVGRNHFGKSALEAFIVNIYSIQPLMDPDLKKIKYNITGNESHDLISYIYIRFAPDLINFPIEGNRKLNLESIKKAKKINSNLIPYKVKSNYNKNFFIDKKRFYRVTHEKGNNNANGYLNEVFNSPEYYNIISRLYGKNVYDWAKEYSYKSNYYPFRHQYSLLAIIIIKGYLLLNEKYINKNKKENYLKEEIKIINYLLK